ncbi:hypothetical protein FQA47_007946 [Oryzias melastigma]|uniref:Uncharacterized protein n=1 Tax=Oryzias melastigma TaxID=30732 RepID=A0A834F7Q6_ORYME|nr:hypothetical protein FQA47_007946 [Oryzias melastigma]
MAAHDPSGRQQIQNRSNTQNDPSASGFKSPNRACGSEEPFHRALWGCTLHTWCGADPAGRHAQPGRRGQTLHLQAFTGRFEASALKQVPLWNTEAVSSLSSGSLSPYHQSPPNLSSPTTMKHLSGWRGELGGHELQPAHKAFCKSMCPQQERRDRITAGSCGAAGADAFRPPRRCIFMHTLRTAVRRRSENTLRVIWRLPA